MMAEDGPCVHHKYGECVDCMRATIRAQSAELASLRERLVGAEKLPKPRENPGADDGEHTGWTDYEIGLAHGWNECLGTITAERAKEGEMQK